MRTAPLRSFVLQLKNATILQSISRFGTFASFFETEWCRKLNSNSSYINFKHLKMCELTQNANGINQFLSYIVRLLFIVNEFHADPMQFRRFWSIDSCIANQSIPSINWKAPIFHKLPNAHEAHNHSWLILGQIKRFHMLESSDIHIRNTIDFCHQRINRYRWEWIFFSS